MAKQSLVDHWYNLLMRDAALAGCQNEGAWGVGGGVENYGKVFQQQDSSALVVGISSYAPIDL